MITQIVCVAKYSTRFISIGSLEHRFRTCVSLTVTCLPTLKKPRSILGVKYGSGEARDIILARPVTGKIDKSTKANVCFIYHSILSVGPLEGLYKKTLADLSFRRQLHFFGQRSTTPNIVQRIFTHLYTVVYNHVLVYTAELTGASWRRLKYSIFETAVNEIRTGALSTESPAFYR